MDNVISQSREKKTKAKETIIQLLSNLANPKEIEQYLKRFVGAGKTHFAVIKVGGSILKTEIDSLCSSLAFLEQIGLFPIIVHGAGPQLSEQLIKQDIDCQFIEGQRVTSSEVLHNAKKVFTHENLKLSNRLQSLGVRASSITSGVFIASPSKDKKMGLVGEIVDIDLSPIKTAIENGSIPILSSLGETLDGQLLNINADMATNQLAIALKPYKIIFLTGTGGILDEHNKIISSINLVTDFNYLVEQPWLNGGMKLKLTQIAEILSQLPSTASVSITKPANLAKELFTHKGSGTLVRKGESIMTHESIESIKLKKLKNLIESSFKQQLENDYFEALKISKAYITYCYRAAAVVTFDGQHHYLDKFVVADEAKGEGLGKVLWEKLTSDTPAFYWRSKVSNPINPFYFNKASGMQKSKKWFVFWKGIDKFDEISSCVAKAKNKPASFITADTVAPESFSLKVGVVS
ncbi:acetylglutamate kinase [Aliikangiella sp. G2MR2-5]|uniref:acetylglutamate kinase n=1 Tax=Aliikangiella sp. G2MR2-5 TaxID=2788943 RepID=UPI0018AAC74B|nr:acetylglutamate kinase [Aliikangiella sp. G2MR2-5]